MCLLRKTARIPTDMTLIPRVCDLVYGLPHFLVGANAVLRWLRPWLPHVLPEAPTLGAPRGKLELPSLCGSIQGRGCLSLQFPSRPTAGLSTPPTIPSEPLSGKHTWNIRHPQCLRPRLPLLFQSIFYMSRPLLPPINVKYSLSWIIFEQSNETDDF